MRKFLNELKKWIASPAMIWHEIKLLWLLWFYIFIVVMVLYVTGILQLQ